MTANKDYYEILGVSSDASTEEIKEAYIYKVNILHPDRLIGVSERIRSKAEEDLKAVNEAYATLSNLGKRRQYDSKIFSRSDVGDLHKTKVEKTDKATKPEVYSKTKADKAPKPEVYPKTVQIKKGLPYVKQKGSFFIRNAGGHFTKILISKNLPSWITEVKSVPLQEDGKLPMRVDVEVMGIHWGRKYSSEIIVRLDETEARVKVELQMEKSPPNMPFKGV